MKSMIQLTNKQELKKIPHELLYRMTTPPKM